MVTPGIFVVHVLGHLEGLEGRDPDQDVDLVQDVAPGQRLQPDVQPIGVEDQVGLEELRPGVDLLVLADGLESRLRGEGRGGRPQEILGWLLKVAPVQVTAFVTHAAQQPQHLDRVDVDHVRAA